MKLFDGLWAPSPRKVRIYLAEKGIKVERVTLDLRNNEQRQPAYLAINPRGTLPALLLDDGTVIDESTAICRYFEELYPEPNLFGRGAHEVAMVEAWTRRVETDCYAAVANVFRNSLPALKDRAVSGQWPALPQIPELVTRGRIMFECFTEAANERLAKSAYIASDRYTFADIALQVTMDFAKSVSLTPDDSQNHLIRWWTEVGQRKSAAA